MVNLSFQAGIMFNLQINFCFCTVDCDSFKNADIDPDPLFRKRSRSLRVLDSSPSLAIFLLVHHGWDRLMQGSVTVRSSIDFLTSLWILPAPMIQFTDPAGLRHTQRDVWLAWWSSALRSPEFLGLIYGLNETDPTTVVESDKTLST